MSGRASRFVAGLTHDGLTAPWVLDGARNRASFDAYVAHRPAPALRPGLIVVADTLSSHKSGPATAILRARGCDLIFLRPYSPDLNPIDMAFSTLKALIRKAAARRCEALWKHPGKACDLFLPQECRNDFTAAGHGSH